MSFMAGGLDYLIQKLNPRLLTAISALVVVTVLFAFAGQFVLLVLSGEKNAGLVDSESSGKIVPEMKVGALSDYLAAVSAKQLFEPPEQKQQAPVKTVGIADLIKGYELTGVVELDQREAIIKDQRSRQSYFVNEGSTIGELTVEKIESDKVILRYKEETQELRIV